MRLQTSRLSAESLKRLEERSRNRKMAIEAESAERRKPATWTPTSEEVEAYFKRIQQIQSAQFLDAVKGGCCGK